MKNQNLETLVAVLPGGFRSGNEISAKQCLWGQNKHLNTLPLHWNGKLKSTNQSQAMGKIPSNTPILSSKTKSHWRVNHLNLLRLLVFLPDPKIQTRLKNFFHLAHYNHLSNTMWELWKNVLTFYFKASLFFQCEFSVFLNMCCNLRLILYVVFIWWMFLFYEY